MIRHLLRMVCFSTVGILAFFAPLTIGTKTTILLDHTVTFLITDLRETSCIITFCLLMAGASSALVRKE